MAFQHLKKLMRRARNWNFERKAKRASLKRTGKGPFRGPTSPKVFQTVDVGTGLGQHIQNQASRFRDRKYAAVDPAFEGDLVRDSLSPTARIIEQKGVHVDAGNLKQFIDKMTRAGQRTRYFNVDMPTPIIDSNSADLYSFHYLFQKAPAVLLPNGKVFCITDSERFASHLEKLAQNEGLSCRRRKPLPEQAKTSTYMKVEQKPLIRIEITYGLKKAIPDKKKRRNWPRE
jgi:tRNA G46 methylase TrmB